MHLPTRIVAKLIDLPKKGLEYAKLCMADHGLQPVKLERDGRRTSHYTTAQVAAVKLFYGLKKLGIGQPFRVALCGKIAALPDEALEAKLAAGQRYLLKGVGSPVIVTDLLTLEAIQQYLDERRGNPTAPQVVVLDLLPAFNDLFEAVRQLTTSQKFEAAAGDQEGTHADS